MLKKLLIWFKTTFGDTWVSKMIEKSLYSLDNSNKGLSGKKLTIISLMYCVIKMHEYWCSYAFLNRDFSLFPVILGADFGAILALFGINEYCKKKTTGSIEEKTIESTSEDATESTTETTTKTETK
jgi:hypothetical protein